MSLQDLLFTGANLAAAVFDAKELIAEGHAPVRAIEIAAIKAKKRAKVIVKDLNDFRALLANAHPKPPCACGSGQPVGQCNGVHP